MPGDADRSTSADPRFEQVLAEILLAEEAGQPLDLSHAARKHPDLEGPLRAFFRDRDGFDRLAPHLAPTAARPAAPPAPPDLPAGGQFAGYEILRELGRGGMGVVYLARQLSPEREVALKVIRTDRLADLTPAEAGLWMERFRREAQLVASLEQYPNLVTLYEVGEQDGRPFFTMQLVRGGSLAETMRAGQWAAGGKESASRAARLLAAVARAVHHAHRSGVLHRDLKPGNILLDGEGRPLVSDFGLARRLDQSGSLVSGAIEGTAAFMAPEQAAGAKGGADDRRRRVQPGCHPLRAADGPAAVSGQERPGHPAAGDPGRGGPAAPIEPAPEPRSGCHLPEMSGKGAGPALRLGGGAG